MDQYLSAVVIALITGFFSVITIIIQKKQDKVINQINEQTTFIEKEKILKQRLTDKEREREALIQQIMILILDTNLYILKNTDVGGNIIPTETAMSTANDIKKNFDRVTDEIAEIKKEYDMVLELTSEISKKIAAEQALKKK